MTDRIAELEAQCAAYRAVLVEVALPPYKDSDLKSLLKTLVFRAKQALSSQTVGAELLKQLEDTKEICVNLGKALKQSLAHIDKWSEDAERLANLGAQLLQDSKCDAGCWSGMDPCSHQAMQRAIDAHKALTQGELGKL
jgi:hypothetical protein